MTRLLNDGTWSKPPFLTGARQLVVRNLFGTVPSVRLGDIAEFVNGTSYDSAQLVDTGGTPIIRISNVSDPSTTQLRTTECFAERFMVEPGDLLVSWSASFKSLVWPGPPAVLNQHIFRVREKEGVDKAYLRHAIEASLDEMLENAVGMGMKHLRRADFLGHKIPLPSGEIQAILGTLLDAIGTGTPCPPLPESLGELKAEIDAIDRALNGSDAALQRFRAAEADLSTLRQRILDDAVRGRLTERNPDDEPAGALLKRIAAEKQRRFKAGEIGKPKATPPVGDKEQSFEVPEGWAWVRFGTVAEHRLGKMLDKQKNTGPRRPYLRNVNVRWFGFNLSDILEMQIEDRQLEEYSVTRGDIMICEGGEPGRAAIWDRDEPFVFQKALHRARPFGGVEPKFLVYLLDNAARSGRLAERFTGATIQHLTGQSLARLAIPLPPVAEQRRIVKRVDQLMALCDQLDERLGAAKEDAERLTQVVLAEALAA